MAQGLENHRFDNVNYFDSDERGRITLGSDFADEKVFVAWSTKDTNPKHIHDPSDAEKQVLTDLWKWAKENDYKMIDSDPYQGRILNSEAEWIDTDIEGLGE